MHATDLGQGGASHTGTAPRRSPAASPSHGDGRRHCDGVLHDFFTEGDVIPCGRPAGHPGEHFPSPLVEDLR